MSARDTDERRGRGRLSSIDMLPDEAEPAIVWALEALRARRLPQSVILSEFNEKLADISAEHQLDPPIKPITKSAFSRYSVRKAIIFRKIDEAQQVGSSLVEGMDPETPAHITTAVAELIKAAAFQILEDETPSTKGLMELSRALAGAVKAQSDGTEYSKRLARDVEDKLAEARKKIGEVAKAKGVSPEAMSQINAALGVK